jgi:hypothetical protein
MKTKNFSFLMLLVFITMAVAPIIAQKKPTTYEVEILRNEGKDTREFNSKLNFGDEGFKIVSSRNATLYVEMNYADIQTAEYSFAKKPYTSKAATVIISTLFPLAAVPLFFMRKKLHWLTITTDKNFTILKLEGDNYRQIITELEIRNIKVEKLKE